MTKIDDQHRLRGLNWQIPWVLVNLYFQQDLIRKPSRRTYSSKEITEFCLGINVGRFQKTPGDSTEAGLDPLTCGASRSHLEVALTLWALTIILFVMSVLHCLLGCISTIYSSYINGLWWMLTTVNKLPTLKLWHVLDKKDGLLRT